MKRLFMIAAMAATALSCSESISENFDNTPSTSDDTAAFTLTAAVGDDDTRVTADNTTGYEWTFKWVSGDTLYAYIGSSSNNRELPMTTDGFNESASTFDASSLDPDTEYTIFHGNRKASSTATSASTYNLYINEQDGTLSNIPLMSETNVKISSGDSTDQTLSMKHLCAFMNLNITFGDDMSGYTLTKVVLPEMPYTIRMNSTTTYTDPYVYTGVKGITVTLQTSIAASGVVTVPVVIPTVTVDSGTSILIYLYLDKDGEEVIVPLNRLNKSSSAWVFGRATVIDLGSTDNPFTCSQSDLLYEFDGSGTAESPYQISTAKDLNTLSSSVALGNTYSGEYFEMTNNIDLGGSDSPFTAIGSSSSKSFAGTFDGGGKEVSGLYIYRTGTFDNIGLFGYTSSASTIKNLGVSGTIETSNSTVGGVVAYNYGTITNCYSSCTLSGSSVGGVVAYNYGTITNCYNSGQVSGDYVGGVVAYNYGTITNCYNSGALKCDYTAGGVANNNDNGTITSCYYLDTNTYSGVADGSSESSTTSKTADELKALTSELNANAVTYNSGDDVVVAACAWKDGSGDYLYPTLNFGETPTASN